MYKIITPKTEEQFRQYYQFRWQILREPFNYPKGSEKDEYENVAEHRMVLNNKNEIIAVGRCHFNTAEEVQIRHIAVSFDAHGKGMGRVILSALENFAVENGAIRAVTNSLETSEHFFRSCGYVVADEAAQDLMRLKRLQMVKKLGNNQHVLVHPEWCQTLQETWQTTIPISDQMGIKIYQYSGDTLEVRASLNKNINLHGTMFAGSIFSLATLTGWGMIYLQLREQGLSGDIVLGDSNIHYHKPITAQPRAIADLAHYKAAYKTLNSGKKMQVELIVKIMDGTKAVAEFTGVYWILNPGPSESKHTENTSA
ncbi:bifunctional GNAT family N-acetyltransferase/hotdog fold thioesterase [Opacimonas viscosa]|uniref:Bifunctional GNAT family N-acetyltransferase/hotdog fold thioesterase n=1 Tax=Opacimonas viscosa TaxID=2961944 RepID=A0AA41X456_9ALTE|nr:bifunctional GNAT family N-acetyltransferase/hotdog fold thioesterase [Opacimonas viscosa]MCP3429133.1 bifunctional GNAT family N-acetyltransferase/hotdog fold thioesterase [Opacimonas viscosa]